MARSYRLQGEGLLYHITSRGDDRKKIFISELDYHKFLAYIKSGKEKYRFCLYAYCLMGNHYHLLIETMLPNISKIMQYINTAYTVYYNTKHKRNGHLFQGRYKAIVVDKEEYLLELTRYIHLNPVRAKIVDSPEKFRWSSYHEYIKKTNSVLIDNTELEDYFKMNHVQYAEFVRQGINEPENPFRGIYAGFILGSEKFIKETMSSHEGLIENGDYSHKREIRGIEPEGIIKAAADYYKTNKQLLRESKKKSVLAKKVLVYLLKQYTCLTNKTIGLEFGLTYSAVSKIARDVERLIGADKMVKNDIRNIISHFKV